MIALAVCSSIAVGWHSKLHEANGYTQPPPHPAVSGLVWCYWLGLIESQRAAACVGLWFGKPVCAAGKDGSDLPAYS